MKVSVAMATYNGEAYIEEQLNSLRDQTMKIDEVIICDDGSKDKTVLKISQYITVNKLDNWKVIINEKNLGYANNFHKALMLTNGDYIFFCDQDDIWDLDKIEIMVKTMEQNPQIALLCSDYEPFSCSDDAPSISKSFLKRVKNDNSLEQLDLNRKNIYISSIGCVMGIRKSFRDMIEPFWISGWAHDDYVWKTAQCIDGCYILHKSLIKRRLHSGNVSMRKKHSKLVRTAFLRELRDANIAMEKFAVSKNISQMKISFIRKTIRAIELRLDMVDNCKLFNSIKLLAYLDCYQNKKSILMELYIAIKYRKV